MGKRTNVALLVGDVRDVYSNSITRGAMRAARESGCNLLIVPGRYYHARRELLYEEFEYQYQTLFSYFKKNNVDAVIACTGVVGIVSGSMSRNSLAGFLKKMDSIPLVTVSGDNLDLPNIRYDNKTGIKEGMEIMISRQMCTKIAMVAGPKDNLDSMERVEAYKEVLTEHGIHINEKLIIYCDFTERCVSDVVNLFKSVKGIDGVVFANDRMAIGGYEAMRELGLRVGRDVSFMGYDNIENDINLDPPLASVVADPENIGYEAFYLALDYMKTGEVEHKIIPTKFISRDSIMLGNKEGESETTLEFTIDKNTDFDTFAKRTFIFIYNPSVNESNKDKLYRTYLFLILEIEKLYKTDNIDEELIKSLSTHFNKLFEIDERRELDIGKMMILLEMIKEVIVDSAKTKKKKLRMVYISAYVYRRLASILSLRENDTNYRLKKLQHEIYRISADMIGFYNISEKNYASIISNFGKIDINYTFLYLFKEPIAHGIDDEFEPDEFVYLKAAQVKDKFFSPSDREQMIPLSEMFDNAFSYIDYPSHLVMLNLYVRDMIYGVMLCDLPYEIFSYYESLIYQVSCAARILSLLMENEETDRQLNESLELITKNNIKLADMAKSDELTGVRNRRGFMLEAESLLKENNGNKYVVVGFADADGLKGVNDKYGHEEGDYLIETSAKILNETLNNRSVIGRMGGDEFALLYLTNKEGEDQEFFSEFEKNVKEYNKDNEKEYELSVSLGVKEYVISDDIDLKNILYSADKDMYHIKKERKK